MYYLNINLSFLKKLTEKIREDCADGKIFKTCKYCYQN